MLLLLEINKAFKLTFRQKLIHTFIYIYIYIYSIGINVIWWLFKQTTGALIEAFGQWPLPCCPWWF